MKYLKPFSLILICILLFSPASLLAEGVYFEQVEFQAALAKAKANKKLLFLDAVTDWCGPCKWMTAEVFPDGEVGAFFNKHFINLKVDMEKGEGPALAERFEVNVYPSLMFINGEGEVVTKVLGARSASALLSLGERVLSGIQPLESLTAKFESGQYDRKWLFSYIMRLTDEQMEAEAPVAAFRPGMAGERLLENENWTIFETYFQEIDSPEFEYLVANIDSFRAKLGKATIDNKVGICYSWALMDAAEEKAYARYDSLREVVLKLDIKDAEKDIYRLDLRKYEQQLSADGYAHMVVGVIESGKIADYYNLNSLAWYFYETQEDPEMLALAVKWAERAVDLKRTARSLKTYGMLLFKSGQQDQALAACNEAIALLKAMDRDPSGIEKEMSKWLD